MPLGHVLYESGDVRYASFPTTCIVSLIYVIENGAGRNRRGRQRRYHRRRALHGRSNHSESGRRTERRLSLSAGGHLPLKQFNRYGPLPHLLLRSTQALITQMEHMRVCLRPHSVDRFSANELTLLQIPLQYSL
jgi:hypothetical protein